jgi:hypothetical protein
MLSEEWQKTLSWGIAGEDYQVGADGVFSRTDEQRKNYKDITWRSHNRLDALLDMLPKHHGQVLRRQRLQPRRPARRVLRDAERLRQELHGEVRQEDLA